MRKISYQVLFDGIYDLGLWTSSFVAFGVLAKLDALDKKAAAFLNSTEGVYEVAIWALIFF